MGVLGVSPNTLVVPPALPSWESVPSEHDLCLHLPASQGLLLLQCEHAPRAAQWFNSLQVLFVRALNCPPTPFLQCRFSKKPLMVIHHLEECPYSQGEQSKPFQTTLGIKISQAMHIHDVLSLRRKCLHTPAFQCPKD